MGDKLRASCSNAFPLRVRQTTPLRKKKPQQLTSGSVQCLRGCVSTWSSAHHHNVLYSEGTTSQVWLLDAVEWSVTYTIYCDLLVRNKRPCLPPMSDELFRGLGHVTSGPLASWRLIFLLVRDCQSELTSQMLTDRHHTGRPDQHLDGRRLVLTSARLSGCEHVSASHHNDDADAKLLTQTCWFLNERQKQVAVERMNRAQTGVKNTHLKWPQVWEALTDWRVWLIVLQMLFCQAVGAVQSNFLGIIIKGLGYTALNAQLLTAPNFAIQVGNTSLRNHRYRLNVRFAHSSSPAFWCASLQLISNALRI